MPATSSKRRTGACVECNKRKIRCEYTDNWEEQARCNACHASGIDCVLRSRKKRKSVSASARLQSESSQRILEPQPQANADHALPYQYWGPATGPWESAGSPLAIEVEGSPHMPSHTSGGSRKQKTTETATYIGRSHYIAHDLPIDENSARAYRASKDKAPSQTEIKTLELWGCSILPPKPVRQSLTDTFMQRCYPWTPVLSLEDIDTERLGKQASLLLSQALFLAASRVSSAPGVTAFASPEQFYQRAKALFWLTHEKNPLTVIAATTLLQWYNPDGPEHVSFDTSRFWLQIGVGLAHQVGLHKEPAHGAEGLVRRRLWWSLVARDSLISSGQGRPRVINLKDSDIRPPCVEDFPGSPPQGELFSPYVEICILLGDLTECHSRKHMPRSKKTYLENALYRWIKTLPESLRLSHRPNGSNSFTASASNFNARQLHFPYLITLTIMARSMTSYPPRQETNSTNTLTAISPVAILASSFVAGIFEEFLARDELQFLGPIFTFYLLAAGIALVSTRRDPTLWRIAQQDLEVLQDSLRELSKRWPSAIGALRGLRNVIDRAAPGVTVSDVNSNVSGSGLSTMLQLSAEQKTLLEDLPYDLCRLWPYLATSHDPRQEGPQDYAIPGSDPNYENLNPISSQPHGEITERMTAEILGNLRYPPPPQPARELSDEPRLPAEAHLSMPILDAFAEPGGDRDGGIDSVADYQYAGIGDWLLTDWGTEMTW